MARLYSLALRALPTCPTPWLPFHPTRRTLHHTRHLQSTPKPDMSNHPLVRKMQGNARVMSAMTEAMQLLQRKGFVNAGEAKPPSFARMMQMMGDQEVKDKFVEVQRVMKEEGVAFSPADLAGFMGSGGGGGMGMGDADAASKQGEPEAAGEAKEGLLGRISSKLKFRS